MSGPSFRIAGKSGSCDGLSATEVVLDIGCGC